MLGDFQFWLGSFIWFHFLSRKAGVLQQGVLVPGSPRRNFVSIVCYYYLKCNWFFPFPYASILGNAKGSDDPLRMVGMEPYASRNT